MNDPHFFSNEEKSNNLDPQTLSLLGEAGKWARFLAIIGFIGVGLLVILAFFMGALFSTLASSMPTPAATVPGPIFTIIYLIIAAIYYFPIKYQYDFGSSALAASKSSSNSMQIVSAINSLKKHFKFIAIIAIVILSLYALVFVFTFFAAFLGHNL